MSILSPSRSSSTHLLGLAEQRAERDLAEPRPEPLDRVGQHEPVVGVDVGRAPVGVGDLLRRPDVVDVPVRQQHRGGGEPVLVQNPAERTHRPLAGVDDDGVRPGPLRQHVAVAGQHACRKSGDQHDVHFPIPCGWRASWPSLSYCWHTRCGSTSTRGGPRRCRPTNSGGRQRSANSSDNWSDGPRRHAGGGCTRSSAPPWWSSPWSPGWRPTSCHPQRLRQHGTTAATTPPIVGDADRNRPRGRRPAARVQGACRSRRQLPVPGRAGGQQAEQAAAHRQGADRPGTDQRQHVHRPGQHRHPARQRQGAVHGQQLRQPGPAGLLQRHPVPPADHQPRPFGAAVRRSDRVRQRRTRATSSPTSTRPTSSSPTIRNCRTR